MNRLLSLSVLAVWAALAAGMPAASQTAAPTAAKKTPYYTNAELFTTAARPFSIIKADPALGALISPAAKLESLGDRFGLTEGPVWMPQGESGYLLVSDLIANVIYKITPDHLLSDGRNDSRALKIEWPGTSSCGRGAVAAGVGL